MSVSHDLVGVKNPTGFAYVGADGSTTSPTSAKSVFDIREFTYSPTRWGNTQNAIARRTNPWTLDSILGQNIAHWRCLHCKEKGQECHGEECVAAFRENAQLAAEALEIRADPDKKLGFGVYVKHEAQGIPAGSILGEWIGELLPEQTPHEDLLLDEYAFSVDGVGYVTAKNHGNWTRFIHHTCFEYNVLTKREMYGKRIVMAFIARTDIRPGDQLFINYGRTHFEQLSKFCSCAWGQGSQLKPVPHLPPTQEELDASGRVVWPKPAVVDTLANMRTCKAANNPFPQTHTTLLDFKETRTFDIDISADGSYLTTREFTIPRGALGLGRGRGPRHIDIDLVLKRRTGGSGGVIGTVAKTTT